MMQFDKRLMEFQMRKPLISSKKKITSAREIKGLFAPVSNAVNTVM